MISNSIGKTGFSIQVMNFLFVGIFTFAVDYSLMIFLVEILDVNYLNSTASGFIAGSILNYYLSVKYVFINGKYENIKTEMFVFMIFTFLGLALNHLIMYAGCNLMENDYRFIKIFSLFMVTIFNFITKKLFVFIK
ncbi:MAG: GtrA family protein [archaeon]|nr:GtrA family protein [archaeon]